MDDYNGDHVDDIHPSRSKNYKLISVEIISDRKCVNDC